MPMAEMVVELEYHAFLPSTRKARVPAATELLRRNLGSALRHSALHYRNIRISSIISK